MKPNDKLKALQRDSAAGRIEYCRMMLRLHGFLSDSENRKVLSRYRKWIDAALTQRSMEKRRET